jgi:hypothetical protein
MKTSRLLTTTSLATLLSSLALVACGGAEVEPAAQKQTGLTPAPAEPGATTPAPEAMGPEAADHRRHRGARGERGHGPPSLEKMIERFDTNKNGTLETAELPERMQKHIGDIDTSGDSVVTKDELAAHFKARFAEHAKKRFERKDVNHDGFLDQTEVGDKWSKLSVADQNGDLKLTPDELKAAFESGKLKPGFGKGRGKPHKE